MTTHEQATEHVPDIPHLGRAVVDVASAWDVRMDRAMRQGSAIYAFRGAGSTGGIDPEAADRVLEEILVPEITRQQQKRRITVVYDGDPDSLTQPDIGYIVGRLRDTFDPAYGYGVDFLIAQADDWYYPPVPGSNLTNAHGRPSETFVFPRGRYEGDHNRFTQSEALAAYPRYKQIYVGAAGMLAAQQMVDYCHKVPDEGPVNITLIRALINQSLSHEIGERLAQAATAAERAKFEAMQEQRRQVYGLHWNSDGRFNTQILQEIRQASDSHELVVLWDRSDKIDIVNCRKIDLNSAEISALFEQAPYYIKTQPIRARQVRTGTTETVIVNSGATRDIAKGGDWVCSSVGSGEEYVVHATDFPDIYEPAVGAASWFKPKRDPRKLVKVSEDVIFRAPWGELQAVKRGGYLIERTIRSGKQAGQTERYGIAQKDAEPDFVLA